MSNISKLNYKKYEIVHIMLKPEALKSCLRKTILKKILDNGCRIILSKKLKLNIYQINEIYANFEDRKAKCAVLAYYISRQTEHFAVIGHNGLHEKILEQKGSIYKNTGIRGKYHIKEKMTSQKLFNKIKGVLPGVEESVNYIDFNFFGRDLLHSSDTQKESWRAINAIFTKKELDYIKMSIKNNNQTSAK